MAGSQPQPAHHAVGLHVGPGPKPHHTATWDQVAGGRLLHPNHRARDLGISIIGRALQPGRVHDGLGLGEGLAKASGTSTLSRVVAVVAGTILAALVAGCPAVGVVRTSRPATASAARPTSTIATVATRLDATRMLPPMRLGPARLTIPTNAAAGRRVHPDPPSSMCGEVLAEPVSSWAAPGRGELAGAGEQGGGDLVADVALEAGRPDAWDSGPELAPLDVGGGLLRLAGHGVSSDPSYWAAACACREASGGR
jgi:hypothetical protein